MNSLGVLGDLCREVEWIQRRIQFASRSIQHCHHMHLQQRLAVEISFYRNRCLVIKTSLANITCHLDSHSIQKRLLEELISRCLLMSQVHYPIY